MIGLLPHLPSPPAPLPCQASLLCVLEERLYAPSHSDYAGEIMYPAYCVLMTSAAGIAAARWLHGDGLLPAAGSWVLHSLYLAKLAMLALPEAYLVLPTALMILAALSPLFLYEPEVPRHGREYGAQERGFGAKLGKTRG